MYARLALSEDKPEEESDYNVENDPDDDIYNILAFGGDASNREDK